MAQMIAGQLAVVVRRVVDAGQVVRLDVVAQYLARHIEQRPPCQARADWTFRTHAGQSFRPGTAQQFQQYGFRLIILMMAEDQPLMRVQVLGEDGIARMPRGGLQADTAGAVHFRDVHVAGESQRGTERTAMGSPASALRVQAMIHVDGSQVARTRCGKMRQSMQQCGGIGAAAVGDAELPIRMLVQRLPQEIG